MCDECELTKTNLKSPQSTEKKRSSVKDLLLLSSRLQSSLNDLTNPCFSSVKKEPEKNVIDKPAVKKRQHQQQKKNPRNLKKTSVKPNGKPETNCRAARSTRSSNGKDLKKLEAEEALTSKISPTGHTDEPTIGHIKRDEEDHHAVSVIVSLDDSFTLKQDMCLNCGSFGKFTDDSNRLLCCSQCGQCYHTYCAGVGVCNVMLSKGWRCLDCTVCEGCGKATDEPRLLLCDDCDISYHIYCLDPPLDQVPKGNWKCKWCVKCQRCGTREAGPNANSEWKNNYTECEACFSLTQCHVCEVSYNTGDSIVKCQHCNLWSHVSCRQLLLSEEDTNRLVRQGFSCDRCVKKKEASVAVRGELDNKAQSDLLEELCKFKKPFF